MSWTVMVCVAEELLPASSVAVKVRTIRSARCVASSRFARNFNCHLTAVVRRCGVIHGHFVGALYGVVGRDEGEFRSRGVRL